MFWFSEATPVATDFTKAIQARNLKKVDPEEEKKRREQAQQNRSECKVLFSFNPLTPAVTEKVSLA